MNKTKNCQCSPCTLFNFLCTIPPCTLIQVCTLIQFLSKFYPAHLFGSLEHSGKLYVVRVGNNLLNYREDHEFMDNTFPSKIYNFYIIQQKKD